MVLLLDVSLLWFVVKCKKTSLKSVLCIKYLEKVKTSAEDKQIIFFFSNLNASESCKNSWIKSVQTFVSDIG